MKKLWELIGGWVLLVVLLGFGFFAGRASVRVDDQDLRDSLSIYRYTRKVDKDARDSLVRVILFARTAVDIAEGDATRARAQARQFTVSAGRFGARADSLERLLAFAKTPADSIPILLAACTERRNECADLRKANDSLFKAAADDSTAKAGLRVEIAAHLKTRDDDSANAVRADRLIGQLEKQARGCRIPFVGVPCPTAVVNYDLDAAVFQFGGGIPIKPWLTVSVTTRLSPGGKAP